jgi:hypothetical protein
VRIQARWKGHETRKEMRERKKKRELDEAAVTI